MEQAIASCASRPECWGAFVENDQENEYLRPAEVARILHVSTKTVTRWASQGWLPCLVTLGGHRRFRREDVEEVARKMATRPNPN